ncbi:phytoene synthase [Sulfodiicoccus acidiphilus]|uniref:Phytoene synthase n=1 Tax=Sulfodiicoccus acidiphilus TaxID=1670455 RepID=A0A348B645_9CREN|nr:phytoene/squalene synthase family protein [Sulfodiicoccus acidiphilus]BBD73647.1 phytoene synthase [Sulfodiicoccus acidiphilus]GGU02071.1 phytoene synthase [Sulfodiicoccus acidiphilus]
MSDEEELQTIFKRGSVTYFNSSVFFPIGVRKDATRLYAFVRVADDLVDSVPQKKEKFYEFVESFREARNGKYVKDVVVNEFVELERRKKLDRKWADDFLKSMEMDLGKSVYKTFDELWSYTWGSAEVIGLMMAKVMDLPSESYPYATALGRAMQFLNFIRDVMEDVSMGRQYLPLREMHKFSLSSLCPAEVAEKPEEFREFLREMVRKYLNMQREAEKGYKYLPLRYLVPIKTASDMYLWTAKKIYVQPEVVYRLKVKPSRERVYSRAIRNFAGYSLWRFLLPTLRT